MGERREERVYLVRMWRDPGTATSLDWRGSVHDVVTGRRLYVVSPGEVAEFISAALAVEPERSPED